MERYEAANLKWSQKNRQGSKYNANISPSEELQGQIGDLEYQLKQAQQVPTVAPSPKSEGFLLKERAMDTLLKLTSMSDIENLAKD